MKFEKLGNIATIKTGKYDVNHSTPDGEFVFYTCAYGQFKSPTYSFEGPAIILPGNGANVGEVFYYNGKFEAYQRTYVVQNFKADPNYIYAYFKAEWKKSLRNKQFGSATNYIRLNNLTDFSIPLPQLPDQLHIANILSKAENLIAQRKESIRLLDEFLKSTFLEMFGSLREPKFQTTFLENISVKITDGTHTSPKFLSKGVPFLLVSNIVDNEIVYETKKYISEEEYLLLNKRTPVEIGDILITSVGSYGNPAIVKTITKFAFQRHIAYIKPNHNKINKTYLFGSLRSDFVQSQIEKVVRGVAQKTLNLSELRKLQIPLPPISLQTQFAQIVEKTEALKSQYQQSLKELEQLYGSLSQKAFKGELIKH